MIQGSVWAFDFISETVFFLKLFNVKSKEIISDH